MNRLRLKAEGGFTLIELLVVIAIIGILAAIAIPQFAAYRRRGFEADAQSAVRNLATAQEGYFVTNQTYKTSANPGAAGQLKEFGFSQGANITASTTKLTGSRFTATARNLKCTTGGGAVFDATTGLIVLTPCTA